MPGNTNNELTIEMLDQIKHKLNKYSNNKDTTHKINLYLDNLNQIKNINSEVLKATSIVDCVKALKKQIQFEYSKKANDLLDKWREIILSQNDKTEGPISNVAVKKEKLTLDEYKKIEKSDTNSNHNNSNKRTKITSSVANNNNTNNSEKTIKIEMTNKPEKNFVPLPTIPLDNLFDPNEFKSNSNTKPVKQERNPYYNNNNNNSAISIKEEAKSRLLSHSDALSKIFSSKQSARLIYTGRKNIDPAKNIVPRLFELCTRALIDNLDELPNRIYNYNQSNTFPIQFDPIKPVLERTSAKQLELVEYYSPNLVDDTDYIWEKIVHNEFKNLNVAKEKNNMSEGVWRDLYFQKLEERELKLKQVREKVSQKNVDTKRQTQMATVKFVSSSVKRSMPLSNNSFSSSSKSLKTSSMQSVSTSSIVPVRTILHSGFSSHKNSGSFSSSSNLASKKPTGPAQSQGMKKTMKLLKSFRR